MGGKEIVGIELWKFAECISRNGVQKNWEDDFLHGGVHIVGVEFVARVTTTPAPPCSLPPPRSTRRNDDLHNAKTTRPQMH
jgi:hypothetical protein